MVFGDIICCVVFVGEAIHCVPMHIHCVSMHIHSTNQQSHNTSKPLMLMEPLNAHFSLQIRRNLIEVIFSYSIWLSTNFKRV